MAVNSNPKPSEPTLSTLAAITGRTTLKFMPKVEMNPMTEIARSTIGVCQTYRKPSPRLSRMASRLLGIASLAAGRSSLSRIASSPITTAP